MIRVARNRGSGKSNKEFRGVGLRRKGKCAHPKFFCAISRKVFKIENKGFLGKKFFYAPNLFKLCIIY